MSFAMITFFSTVCYQILVPIQNVRGSHNLETVFFSLAQDTSHREVSWVSSIPQDKSRDKRESQMKTLSVR